MFNVWDELQREYEDEIKQIGSNASEFKNNKVIKAECWAKACRNTAYLLHDCVINALDTGTRGGLNPMDFAPGDAPKAPKMKDISVIAEQVEQAFESLAESTLDDLYTSPEFTQTITRMSGGTTYKSIPPGVKL